MACVSISPSAGRNIYSDAFKKDVAEYARITGKPYHAVARHFNISVQSAGKWGRIYNGKRMTTGEHVQPNIEPVKAVPAESPGVNPLVIIADLLAKKVPFLYDGKVLSIQIVD